jgi:hypothetical protein
VYGILYITVAALYSDAMRALPIYRSGEKQPIMSGAMLKPGTARRAIPKRITSTTI